MKKRFIPMLIALLPFAAVAASIEPPTDDRTLEAVIIRIAGGLIALMAVGGVFMFIYGGVLMLTAGGNEKQITQAKNVLHWTVYGILTIVLSVSLVQFVFALFGFEPANDVVIPGLSNAPLRDVAVNTMRFVIGLLGVAGVAILVWGGYTWLTAGGNEQQIDKAKIIIKNAVIGLIIIILSWSAIQFVLRASSTVTTANGIAAAHVLDTPLLLQPQCSSIPGIRTADTLREPSLGHAVACGTRHDRIKRINKPLAFHRGIPPTLTVRRILRHTTLEGHEGCFSVAITNRTCT